MTKEEILLAHKNFLFPAVFHYYKEPLVIERAKDQYVWDADGNQYLDFFGGIVTISVGHLNEKVNAKVKEQIDRLVHVSTVFATEPQVALAKKIASLTPEGKLTKSFFTNSGTEANETAVVAARCYTGASEIVALRHSYHGRSALAMTLTAHSNWRLGGVQQPGIVHAVNAYCYRCPYGLTYPECEVRCARDVEEVIRTTTSGKVAGFIAEPIQGVGGFITPPKEYFGIVAGIVRKYGGVFISDEVQTGWGRTGGKWFGIEQYGVTPDIITSAKGLANGFPIGITVARPEIADAMKGATISTFGGNPITTTAAKAVLDYIEENNLRVNTAEAGAHLRGRLLELQEKHSLIGEVRGMGLLQAIELVEDRTTKAPATAATLQLMEATRQNRILAGRGGM
ncbi:MAG: aspartate aminotransferase family protein, partial [Bryobacteraceae bacterium]